MWRKKTFPTTSAPFEIGVCVNLAVRKTRVQTNKAIATMQIDRKLKTYKNRAIAYNFNFLIDPRFALIIGEKLQP